MRKVDSTLRSIFDQMPGAWGCKDENSVFMYANREYKTIVGLKNRIRLINRIRLER